MGFVIIRDVVDVGHRFWARDKFFVVGFFGMMNAVFVGACWIFFFVVVVDDVAGTGGWFLTIFFCIH